jgi:hypothetical protein
MIADREQVSDPATMADDGRDAEEADDHDERCAHCGSPIDVTSWHPLLSRIEDDDIHLYPFCDVDCRDAWLDDDKHA